MPECYRHPGRETNVSCSRCARPICPECMTSTPVGMRCPECARDSTRVRSVSFGGLSAGSAPATRALIVLNVAAFVAVLATGGTMFDGGGTLSADGALYGPVVANGDWYRVITAGFLHAGIFHLGLNCVVLYFLGSLLEPAIGTPRFVAIYVASLIGGSLGALVLDPNQVVVGASGAVFGVMAAAFIIARSRGLDQLASQIGVLVILNLALSFRPGISIGGHLGGLVVGAACALLIGAIERRRMANSTAIELVALTMLTVLVLAGSLLAAEAAKPALGG